MPNEHLNGHEEEPVDAAQEGERVLHCVSLEGRVGDPVVHFDADFGEPGGVSKLGELELGWLVGRESSRLIIITRQPTYPLIRLEQKTAKKVGPCLTHQITYILLRVLWILNMHQKRVMVEPIEGQSLIMVEFFQVKVLSDPNGVKIDLLVNVVFNHLLVLLTICLGACLVQ